MKTFFSLILVGLLSLSLQAQKCSQVDFDAIYAQTQNAKSKFYFPKLLKRFQSLDTTLTNEEYKYLYYGYTRSELYSPMSPEATNLVNLAEQGKIEEAKKLIKNLDESNPININLAYSKGLIAMHEKNIAEMKIYVHQSQGLLKAILDSGNGKTSETAWVVTSIEDEYFILKMMRLQFLGRSSTQCCDIFKIQFGDNQFADMYFNKEKSSEFIDNILKNKGLDENKKKK